MLSGWFGTTVYYDDAGILRLFSFSTAAVADTVAFFIVFQVVARLIPTLITSFCYIKSYRELKTSELYRVTRSGNQELRALWYGIIPLIAFVPGIMFTAIHFFDLFPIPRQAEPLEVYFFQFLPTRIWIFLNLMQYWFLKPTNKQRSDVELSIAETGHKSTMATSGLISSSESKA